MAEVNVDIQEEKRISAKTLFKNKSFVALFFAALFSAPGYYMYLIGVEWLMLTIHDDRSVFGMLFFAASIPRLIFLTTGGLVADRFNKRLIVFLSDIVRAALIILLIVFVVTDSVSAMHLISLAVFFGIADAFSHPALSSLAPVILKDEELQKGNSLIQMTAQISPILGPALGATLIKVLGFVGVFTVSASMLVLSAIAVLFIRLKKQEKLKEKSSAWKDFKAGFSYMRKNELIVTIVILAFFINFFFTGPIAIGLPILIKDVYKSDVLGLATVESSMGIGALVGTIILVIYQLKRPGLTAVWTLIGLGILYTLTSVSMSLYVTAGLVGLMGLLVQLLNIPIFTMMQQVTEKAMLGRMMSFFMTVSTGLVPVSFMVTSLLISADIGIQTIMFGSGIMITILAIFQLRNKRILQFKLTKEG
ncbi:MAG TPA: MFS transporter [Bacillota bacterium]|nr:MFS transporter [Bacillota bacterium]